MGWVHFCTLTLGVNVCTHVRMYFKCMRIAKLIHCCCDGGSSHSYTAFAHVLIECNCALGYNDHVAMVSPDFLTKGYLDDKARSQHVVTAQ